MTSEEALDYFVATCTLSFDKEGAKGVAVIKKELKALKIIKENLNIDEILLAIKGVCNASDYDLVKEVLTNE